MIPPQFKKKGEDAAPPEKGEKPAFLKGKDEGEKPAFLDKKEEEAPVAAPQPAASLAPEETPAPAPVRNMRPVLEHLKEKAHLAESTHDPENIKALMDALNTYLDEELKETASSEDVGQHVDGEPAGLPAAIGDALVGDQVEPGPGDETEEEVEEETDELEEEEVEEVDTMTEADTGGADLRTAIKTKLLEAVADPEKLSALVEQIAAGVEGGGEGEAPAGDAPKEQVQECEAFGHKATIREELASTGTAPTAIGEANGYAEEEVPPSASAVEKMEDDHKKEEETPMQESARSATGLSSEERAELLALRVQARNRELLGAANKMIRESGVMGIAPKELAAFPKEQWSTVIRLARGAAGDELPMVGNADTSGVYVEEIRESATAGSKVAQSARAIFELRMGLRPSA